MIDTVAPHYGSRRCSSDVSTRRGRPVGEQFVVGLAGIKRITVF